MVLSDSAILQAVKEGKIVIDPFDRECLGSNSYDVHLSKHLSVYEDEILDSAKHNPLRYFEIPQSGYILLPGKLYLGSTLEYTETHGFYPELSGKSSTGRLGISIHLTAGNGDVGFSNCSTARNWPPHCGDSPRVLGSTSCPKSRAKTIPLRPPLFFP